MPLTDRSKPMTLLDRLKPEYKKILTDKYCIDILLKHEYYVDLSVSDAQIITFILSNKNLELGILQNFFYEIKQMKNDF